MTKLPTSDTREIRSWWKELSIERGGLRVHKTGALVSYKSDNVVAIGRGFANYLSTQSIRLGAKLKAQRPIRIAFVPDVPRPWYLIWSVLHAAGGKIVTDTQTADAIFYFEDVTTRANNPVMEMPAAAHGVRQINCTCLDVSKSKVSAVFETVFGYPLALDPTAWQGPAVEKSEINGAHDGRVIICPSPRRPGMAYEHLIENSDNGRFIEDYRAPTIGGEIPLVYIKQRSMDYRFANCNDNVYLRRPEQIFSVEEREKLSRFCKMMELDWGGIDVLRDRKSGRIYVVDVNKTDMGPPTALSLSDQVRSVQCLAKAFRTYMSR